MTLWVEVNSSSRCSLSQFDFNPRVLLLRNVGLQSDPRAVVESTLRTIFVSELREFGFSIGMLLLPNFELHFDPRQGIEHQKSPPR